MSGSFRVGLVAVLALVLTIASVPLGAAKGLEVKSSEEIGFPGSETGLWAVRLKFDSPVHASDLAAALVVQVDGKKAEPGLKGNLIVRAFLERKGAGNAGSAGGRMRKTSLGFLPAIPFELTETRPAE